MKHFRVLSTLIICLVFITGMNASDFSNLTGKGEKKGQKEKEVKQRVKLPGQYVSSVNMGSHIAVLCRGEEGKCAVVKNNGTVKIFPDGVETPACECEYVSHSVGSNGYFDDTTNEWVEEFIIVVESSN